MLYDGYLLEAICLTPEICIGVEPVVVEPVVVEPVVVEPMAVGFWETPWSVHAATIHDFWNTLRMETDEYLATDWIASFANAFPTELTRYFPSIDGYLLDGTRLTPEISIGYEPEPVVVKPMAVGFWDTPWSVHAATIHDFWNTLRNETEASLNEYLAADWTASFAISFPTELTRYLPSINGYLLEAACLTPESSIGLEPVVVKPEPEVVGILDTPWSVHAATIGDFWSTLRSETEATLKKYWAKHWIASFANAYPTELSRFLPSLSTGLSETREETQIPLGTTTDELETDFEEMDSLLNENGDCFLSLLQVDGPSVPLLDWSCENSKFLLSCTILLFAVLLVSRTTNFLSRLFSGILEYCEAIAFLEPSHSLAIVPHAPTRASRFLPLFSSTWMAVNWIVSVFTGTACMLRRCRGLLRLPRFRDEEESGGTDATSQINGTEDEWQLGHWYCTEWNLFLWKICQWKLYQQKYFEYYVRGQDHCQQELSRWIQHQQHVHQQNLDDFQRQQQYYYEQIFQQRQAELRDLYQQDVQNMWNQQMPNQQMPNQQMPNQQM